MQHEPLEPECMEAVKERDRQAAADLGFIPHLADACGAEVHTLCKGDHLQGAAVIDCLADNRYGPAAQLAVNQPSRMGAATSSFRSTRAPY